MTKPTEFQALPGQGIEARVEGSVVTLGNLSLMRLKEYALNGLETKASELSDRGRTPMFVAVDREVKGIIAVADAIRPESKQAVQGMQDMGLEVVMLTGDNPRAAQAIAAEAGIQSVLSEMTPDRKTAQVQALQQEGRTVAMVGDGINDAPALAQADVGIAIGAGIDVAMEAADITLMHDDVRAIPRAVNLSRAAVRTIKQNLFWAFFYNTALIPVAAGVLYLFFAGGGVPSALSYFLGEYGFLNPVLAAGAMAVSSVSVLSNSLRLRRFKTG